MGGRRGKGKALRRVDTYRVLFGKVRSGLVPYLAFSILWGKGGRPGRLVSLGEESSQSGKAGGQHTFSGGGKKKKTTGRDEKDLARAWVFVLADARRGVLLDTGKQLEAEGGR